jgi:hypothetical protein
MAYVITQRGITTDEAYRAGVDAYRNGDTFEQNRYPLTCRLLRSAWETGFLDAANADPERNGNF